MKAVFSLSVNGADITKAVQDRLLEIRITDKPGLESDECEIKLDDRDSILSIPPKGATMQVSLGWEGSPLVDFGSYIIDVIRITGGPKTLTFSGKPANLRAQAKSQRSIGYEDTTLAEIVHQIAARNGWEGFCQVWAEIKRADQLGESDLHFITRLSRQYGGTATVKEGKLLVLPRQGGASASGKSLPSITLAESDVFPGWEIVFPDRASFAKVKAKAHDPKTGHKIDIEIHNPNAAPGSDGSEHTDRHIYPDEATAKAAAKSRLESINRKTSTGTLTMRGRGDVSAETTITLQGFKAEADGDFLVESVTQTFVGGGGWQTAIEISAGNQGKAEVGHPKSAPAKPAWKILPGGSRQTDLQIPDAQTTTGGFVTLPGETRKTDLVSPETSDSKGWKIIPGSSSKTD